MSMFNQRPRPPRPTSPGMDRGAQMAARRAERASKPKTAQARAAQRNAEGTPQPAPMPDGSRLSKSARPGIEAAARESDLPRVNKSVTDDEYNFWLQNTDRPFNTPEVNQRVSDIGRRLENEQRFVTQYIDRPYLNPTEQDLANQAMVSAILARMGGGQ